MPSFSIKLRLQLGYNFENIKCKRWYPSSSRISFLPCSKIEAPQYDLECYACQSKYMNILEKYSIKRLQLPVKVVFSILNLWSWSSIINILNKYLMLTWLSKVVHFGKLSYRLGGMWDGHNNWKLLEYFIHILNC